MPVIKKRKTIIFSSTVALLLNSSVDSLDLYLVEIFLSLIVQYSPLIIMNQTVKLKFSVVSITVVKSMKLL